MNVHNAGTGAPGELAKLLDRVADPQAPVELLYALLDRALDPAVPVALLYTALERVRHLEQVQLTAPGPDTPAAPSVDLPPATGRR